MFRLLIKDIVETHPRVKKADKAYYAAVKSSSILSSAAHAMGSYKKNSLQLYAQMMLAGFFAEPKIKLDSEDYAAVMRKKKNKVSRKMGMEQRKLLKRKIVMKKRR